MHDAIEHLIDHIRDSIIGDERAIEGPYGLRRLIYSDYTASGRSLSFIEDFIRDEVLPLYANTHTETSGTGQHTTRLREQARAIVGEAVGAGDDDVVVFCGSGATAAVNKVVDLLNLRVPADLDARYRLTDAIPPNERPVVFIGPYEHHSNELPWRESIADVITIDEDRDGHVDLGLLERALVEHAERPLRIGSFSAASNVTGIETDAEAVASLLHRHGALSFWDFAAAGPYARIDMNPACEPGYDPHMDAVFLSPHKFVGGPQTPGILVAKRALFRNRVPAVPGGGTVAFVNDAEHRYFDDPVHREEGGTPEIVGSIRAGLAMQLKRAVGEDEILAREHRWIQRAIAAWSDNPAIRILGNLEAQRLGIVSFMLRHGERYLHHNFVVALLNDLFGIQSRGGCSCAGPYGHRLLGIDLTRSHAYEQEIVRGCEGIKPGWTRVNFNYFIGEEVFRYVVEAIDMVARDGWRLLPDYAFDPQSGNWRHRHWDPPPIDGLDQISYSGGRFECRTRHATEPLGALPGYLEKAREILASASSRASLDEAPLDGAFEELRWFPTPAEAARELERERREG